jgi:hypothetical protein
MKKTIIYILLFFFCFQSKATNHYWATSGSDANPGTIGSPYQTITKFNSVFSSFSPGDSCLFNRGDVFNGEVIISRSGSSGSPIIIGAYGTGVNPIWSGLVTLSGWTNTSGNLWQSSSFSSLPICNMVLVNGVNIAMGRTPNTGFYTYQSAVGTTSISSTTSLNAGTLNWTGATCVFNAANYYSLNVKVNSANGDTLFYTTTNSNYPGKPGFGFFMENDIRTLDVQNEWYYDPSSGKMNMYSVGSPSGVQASFIDTMLYIRSKSYITFDHINIQGGNMYAVEVSSDHIIFNACNISFTGIDALAGYINAATSTGFIFQNGTISNTNNNAVNLESLFTGALITNNLIKNTGVQPGMGGNGAGNYANYMGVQLHGPGSIAQYNEVDSSGYHGIAIYGNGTEALNNLINVFNLVHIDGAGLYTWVGAGNTPFTGMKMLNNIILNGAGSNSGTTQTGTVVSHGIYTDDVSTGIEIGGNTCAGNAYSGLYLHNAISDNVHDNTFFNNGYAQVLFASYDASNPIRSTTFKNNIMFCYSSTQKAASFESRTTDIPSFFTVADSNYYARPIDDNLTIETIAGATTLQKTLASWQSYSSQDAHSNKSPKTITLLSDLRFDYNPTTSSDFISLPNAYIDVRNVSYPSSITLGSYGSSVLINNGTASPVIYLRLRGQVIVK